MNQAQHASIEFSLIWNSAQAAHGDRLFVPKTDFRRDIFPGSMAQELQQLQPGERIEQVFPAGEDLRQAH